ncbi:MAG: hypothetical protein AB7E96_06915 [Deferribacterales bacterium]
MEKIEEYKHLVAKQVRIKSKYFQGKGIDSEELENELRHVFLILLGQAIDEHDQAKGEFKAFYGKKVLNYCMDRLREFGRKSVTSEGKLARGLVDIDEYADYEGYCKESIMLSLPGQGEKAQYKSAPDHRLRLVFACEGRVVAQRMAKLMQSQGGMYKQVTFGELCYLFSPGKPIMNNLFGITMYALAYEPWDRLHKTVKSGRLPDDRRCVVMTKDDSAFKRLEQHYRRHSIQYRSFTDGAKKYFIMNDVPMLQKVDDLYFFWLLRRDWKEVHHELSATLESF